MAIGSDAEDLEPQTSLARQQGGVTQGLSGRITPIATGQQHGLSIKLQGSHQLGCHGGSKGTGVLG